jgi:small subunit ribosomal protein S17e
LEAQHPTPKTDTLAPSITSNTANMGRVRTKTVKKSAKVIIERYYPKLTLDFETNKRVCDEIAIIASKRLRNKIGKDTAF